MTIKFEMSQIFFLLASTFGLLITSILLFRKKSASNRYNLYLGLSFFILSLAFFIAFLIGSGLIAIFPFAARWGNFMALLFMPFSYVYFRAYIKNISFRFSDCLYFLPALLYLIDYLPFFMMENEEKLALVEDIINNNMIYLSFREGWLAPPWFYLLLRYAVIFFFWVLQLHLLLSVNAVKKSQFLQDNKHWYYWAWTYQILQAFYFVPILLYVILDEATLVLNIFTEGVSAVSLFVLCIYLFFKPEILYGISGIIYGSDDVDLEESKDEHKESHKEYLSNHQVIEIISNLHRIMEKDRLYLNKGYTLQDLSIHINVPTWLLSTLLNHKLDMNFNEFLNKYRIDYCLQKIVEGEYKVKTIEALALECGFNNRNSFTKAFKNFQHKTPSEYIKEVEEKSNKGNGSGKYDITL